MEDDTVKTFGCRRLRVGPGARNWRDPEEVAFENMDNARVSSYQVEDLFREIAHPIKGVSCPKMPSFGNECCGQVLRVYL